MARPVNDEANGRPVNDEEATLAAAAAELLAGVRILGIPIGELREPPGNPNQMSDEELGRLADAIRRFGFLQPVLVRECWADGGRTYELVDGVHRVRAAKMAGLTELPCVLADGMTEQDARALQIGMNKLRGELNLSDVAASIAGLVAGGWSTAELTVTGYSEEELDELVRVATVDETEDALVGASASAPEEPEDRPPKPLMLELEFSTGTDLRRVKRALRRAAGGKGRPLGDGLLAMIDGDK
jgi:ParB/RepB/Spo0J family partition protein